MRRKDSGVLTIRGQTRTLFEWAKSVGLTEEKFRDRLRLGWAPEELVPVGQIEMFSCES